MYNDPKCKPWKSRKWAPPGYADRDEFVKHRKAEQEKMGLESAPGVSKSLGNGEAKHVENAPANGNGVLGHKEV